MESAAQPDHDVLGREALGRPDPPARHGLPRRYGLNPLHAILLGFPVALFVAAVIADIAYMQTAQVQWSNFSSWLIAGGLLFGGFVALWALVDFIRWRGVGRQWSRPLYFLLIAAMWVIGFINALIHSGDAWYSVSTTGLIFSIVTALLALVAAWIGYSGYVEREP